jgi:hypothetical protein
MSRIAVRSFGSWVVVCLALGAVHCGGAFTSETADGGALPNDSGGRAEDAWTPPADAAPYDAAARDASSHEDGSDVRDGETADGTVADGGTHHDASTDGSTGAGDAAGGEGGAGDAAAGDSGGGPKDGGSKDGSSGGGDASVDSGGGADDGGADGSLPDAADIDGGKCVLCGNDTTCCAAGYCCPSLSVTGGLSYCPVATPMTQSSSGGSAIIGNCPLPVGP